MFFYTPNYWQKKSLLSKLLVPFSYLYYGGTQLKRLLTIPYKAPVPVICVGNPTVGGTGKTPVALAIAALAHKQGLRPCFLSRGYGGKLSGPVKVMVDKHTARDVGDEPLLLAKSFDTWVSRNRILGAKAAAASGAGLIIMDDGFQNRSLTKDFSLLVIDGSKGFSNGYMLPAGPLREPLHHALSRAQAAVIVGEDKHHLGDMLAPHLPILQTHIVPKKTGRFHNKAYIAFTGIGNPAKFFSSLEQDGINVVETLAFPDHYLYTSKDIALLRLKAKVAKATLITTEKDAVRLPTVLQEEISTFPITIQWEQEEVIQNILQVLKQ